MNPFAQSGHDLRLEWGPDGVAELGRECAALVVVDVLSFSTTVDLVTSRGGRVRPLRWRGDSVPRPAAVGPAPGLLDLPSPNGATLCAQAAATGATVLAGCLRNASAVAAAAAGIAGARPIGVIPAGERWGVNITAAGAGESLRPCVEDLLGAGAIVAAMAGRPASPEAHLAATAYRGTGIGEALRGCSSGLELIAHGHARDVELAAEVDVSATAPILVNGLLEAA
ncbi:2-phosphosulfolactate phosphatase [Amycolatopsis endophytica]|uniref:Probable 2-phosphosulfolactate phosphatase n=1 Tax=Amycolatopsis endophytica TaxID=860233 RepID=A0A853AVS9_9PSEU|nr:2-phosphosulfolactate phosphatase [Amycolatopsis endophytica]NYI86803.1 2-phosphosulfolactate phosphatase [Amycolatopsis endophytica]